ncbi:calcium/sodium antiporter [Marinovum sp. 2_MG-2023]|uniref:calcium/sodium antiporter n=1 Tax=Roseobacteraceae TaxID=2854170 RepID=UPI001FD3D8BB|nr:MULTISPECIES: calcium/sodium antiporter [Roseobacteraceae]MCJ7872575.1 calcium/sodium antiporter [Phaeobacter sp. J2-8]MDO6730258.1 calcium/sodium antiporter [Marinovum sp. 2_MG-2023]MDO6778996.1 calcium/sodium antiporter [Marinovum sp. 1_MG-2023]
MIVWLLCVLGLVILLLAGDALVKGAVNLSLRVGIPALIVSLTIVAFGTSAPELLIAIAAVHEGAPGLALGNVVGSNTANILMVLGIPAILATLHTSDCDTRKSYFQMLAATALFIALAFCGSFTWVSALVLLAALAVMLWIATKDALAHRRETRVASEEAELEDLEGADPNMPWWKIWMFLLLGLIGLPLGADILVDNASHIARMYGVSDTVIGLTLVALGTSLPELATTVMAALRRQADVALGNVIGSNMFNLLAIIGVAALIGPIPVDPTFLRFDLWVMLGASLLLAPFVLLRWNISRIWGAVLTILYLAYVTIVII